MFDRMEWIFSNTFRGIFNYGWDILCCPLHYEMSLISGFAKIRPILCSICIIEKGIKRL